MKFAVHWAPSVNSCTPGWMAALEEGAHVGTAPAVPTVARGARQPTATSAAEAVAHLRRPFTQENRISPSIVVAAAGLPIRAIAETSFLEPVLDSVPPGVYPGG